MNNDVIVEKLDNIEKQLREIFSSVKSPTKQFNLMQHRVSAYRKIEEAVVVVDRLLEMIETEMINIEEEDELPKVISINRYQVQEHNEDLNHILELVREIRYILLAPPIDYQQPADLPEKINE